MRQVVFVSPGGIGVCASRVFKSLGVRTWCFRPQVDQEESLPFGANAGDSIVGSPRVVQRTYERVLLWFRNSLPDDVAIEVVKALEEDAESSWNRHEFAREVRAALVSRLMRDAWDVVFLDHAVSQFRDDLLVIVKSKRSASVLRQEFGYRVFRVPNVPFARLIQVLRKVRESGRGANAVESPGGAGPKTWPRWTSPPQGFIVWIPLPLGAVLRSIKLWTAVPRERPGIRVQGFPQPLPQWTGTRAHCPAITDPLGAILARC